MDQRWLQGLGIRSVGPAGMSGRVTAIAVVREDPSILYVGTASGGLWKSTSGGIAWQPIFDQQPTQAIGAVAIDPQNPNVIWAGTGEGNPRNSQNSGAGIFRSLDAGKTWKRMGLEETRTIHRIVVHPKDPNTIYVGAHGSAWGPNADRGVFRSVDGGVTWQNILFVNDSTGCADLVMDPTNPNKLIAAMWEYGRKPWFFTSGGKGSGLYLSYDGGNTWSNVATDKQSGLPDSELGRIGVAIAPSEPNIVYAIVEAKENGFYRSTDGGHHWTKQASEDFSNRPFYYHEIYVDPKNENRVYSIYSMVSRSEDGGKNWQVIVPYSGVHPDHHAFYIHPDNPDFMVDGNDGGMAISHDRGRSWRFVENLPLGQFYHVSVDNDTPYRIYGGLQDNGSWAGPSYLWQDDGLRNSNWQEVLFGDGFDVQPHPGNNRYGYAMWQGGNLNQYDRLTGQTRYIRPMHPEGKPLRFNWNAALATDPFDPNGLYYGSQYVHYSADEGRSWTILSPDLTSNDTARQKQALSGGLTIDATTAENFTTLLCIAPSPVEKGLIWTGSDDGKLHLTRDGGKTWTEMSERLPGAPAGSWIPQIVASTHAAGQAFVVLNNYRRNDWKAYAYRTDDYGKTWKRLAGASTGAADAGRRPSAEEGAAGTNTMGHVLSMAQDVREPDLLFLGADNGLWFSLDGGEQWQTWSRDFPAVPVQDLVVQEREGDLVIGTFGRAIWVLDDLEPLRALVRNRALTQKPFALFPVPDAYLATFIQAPGVRFDGDAGFRGQNRPGGARLSMWLHPSGFEKPKTDEKKTDEKKADEKKTESKGTEDEIKSETPKPDPEKIWFVLFAESGDTLRKFSVKADTGFVRRTWDLRERGPRYPSHDKPDKKADEASGRAVLPGRYKLQATWLTHTDSTFVTVLPDPRRAFDAVAMRQTGLVRDRFDRNVAAAYQANLEMVLALETMDRMKSNLETLPDSLLKSLGKTEKILRDSILALQALILTPKDFKGIDGEDRLRDLQYLNYYLLNSGEGPAANAQLALDDLERRTRRILDRVNRFFRDDWEAYRQRIDALPWQAVKSVEGIEIKE
ncbi:MAG: hypothetical protein GC205_12520 [Bacteroidetes bacterium]|nr:hypothetical protein [Bacteroidota bacterium]